MVIEKTASIISRPMNRTLPLLAVTLLFCLPTFARASVVHYLFSGTVDDVPPALVGEFSIGETITGTFSVETTLNGFLFDASALSVTIGGDYTITGALGALSVLDDFGSFDRFHASFDPPLVGAPVNGRSPVEFDLALTLPSTAFSSVAVPAFIPLESVTGSQSSIDFAIDDADTLTFQVTSLAPVPEPTLTVLLGAGALLLARRRRNV